MIEKSHNDPELPEVGHKPGTLNILWEHKFFLTSIIIIVLMFFLKGNIEKNIVIFSVLIAMLLLFFSLFLELPHSRYPIFRFIGQLAWYIAIGSALFMGWVRWINTD
jgi:hypothetical protein